VVNAARLDNKITGSSTSSPVHLTKDSKDRNAGYLGIDSGRECEQLLGNRIHWIGKAAFIHGLFDKLRHD